MGERRAARICRRTLNALLVVTLAPRCAACAHVLDAPLAGPICDLCWAAVNLLTAPFCRVCGDPLPSWRVISAALETCPRCRRVSSAVDAARSAGLYEGSLREIIHAFKFEGRRGLAIPLAAMMRTAGAPILAGADAVVPVPLHPWRRLRRGFNQADDLARRLGAPVARLLWRVQAATQTGLTSAARRRNLRDAFIVSPLAPPLADRIFVLVDDVRTTGATLEACANALKAAGAKEVRALTAANRVRTGRAA
jgi:ComF family protein